MPNTGQVGPVIYQDGAQGILRQNKDGSLTVAGVHGFYTESVYRGAVFTAANAAAIAATAGLSATSTVFTLYNPAGSGVNLALLEVTVVPSGANFGGIWLVANNTVGQAAPATNTSLTIRNALLGGGKPAAGVGLVYSTTTLAAAPVVVRQLGYYVSAAGIGLIRDVTDGIVMVAPGAYVSVQAATAISLQVGMIWEEIPT